MRYCPPSVTPDFFETFLESAEVAFWEMDAVSGILCCTPQFIWLTGVLGGLAGQDFHEAFVAPEDATRLRDKLAACRAGRLARFREEFRLRTPGKEGRWVEECAAVTWRDADGAPRRLAGMLRDVTDRKEAEERLVAENRYRMEVARQAGLGGWEWDAANDRMAFNDDYRAMLGHAPDTMDGPADEVCARLIHPEDEERVKRAFRDYVANPVGMFSLEMRIRHRDGHYLWVRNTGAAVAADGAGRAARIVGGVLNIDGRIRAEMDLRDSLDQAETFNESLQLEVSKAIRKYEQARAANKAIFESNPHLNILFNEQGEAVDCNPVGHDVFMEASKQDVLRKFNRGEYERMPAFQPDGRPSVPFAENVRLAFEKTSVAFETGLFLHGQRVAFDVICKKIELGNVSYVVAYLTDLSRVRRTQRQLIKQSKLLRAINHVASSLVSAQPEAFESTVREAMRRIAEAVDADRMRVWRNFEDNGKLCAKEIYGWSRVSQTGRWYATRTAYSAMPYWEKTLSSRHILNSRVSDLPSEERALIGSQGVLSIMAVPIFIHDAFWGFIGFDDCTQGRTFTKQEGRLLQSGGSIIISAILRNEMTENLIRAREDALASARAKSEFLSRMSHEIRTPMNAIIGMGVIAKKSRDPEKVADCLRKIDVSSRQLLDIINDVLDMSKIEADRFEIAEHPFDFEAMLRNAFAVMQVKFEERRQDFRFDIDTFFSRQLLGDELRLSQVLLNLLSNAVKFTPEGGEIRVVVRETREDSDSSRLRVAVLDTGIGVAGECRDKVFQSFEQGDGSITRRFGGTGLGLAISKKIITLMGGAIWVEDAPGGGAAFVFEIPARWGGPVRGDGAPRCPVPAGIRALVVERNAAESENTAALLRIFCVRPETAVDPEAAVDMAYANETAGTPYDVVFVEWGMPLASGIEAALEIKRIVGDDTLVVITSASDGRAMEREAAAAGVLRFVHKPILPSALYDVLSQPRSGTAPEKPVVEEAGKDWHEKRILLAEDIEINREIVLDILEETGVSVDIAKDGLEAVVMFSDHPERYDMILMDIQMPVLDGISATRNIRGLDVPAAKQVPIVAMTANAFKEDEDACREAGMNGYVAKPIDVDALFSTMSGFLDKAAQPA